MRRKVESFSVCWKTLLLLHSLNFESKQLLKVIQVTIQLGAQGFLELKQVLITANKEELLPK
jgi:hypothetical protein